MITRVNANLDKVGEFKQKCSELYESLKGNKSARIFHITGIDGIDGVADAYWPPVRQKPFPVATTQIGRASCRERV